MKFGGLPLVASMKDAPDKIDTYLEGIYNTVNDYLETLTESFLFYPTTIYLWLIFLAASKELSILLLKLLKCKSNRYSDFILGLRARTAVC